MVRGRLTSRVNKLRVRAVNVPMAEPHQTASGVVSESPLVLTDITTDEGITGHSVVFTYTAAALGPTAALIRNCETLVKNEPLAPADIARKLAKRFRLLGTQGLVGMAIAGIDMALWDALARTVGMPLVGLLGGVPRSVPAYGGIGYVGAEASARAAEQWAQRGVAGVKAKIGYATVHEDLAVVRGVREVAGDRMAIMVDYNQCLTPVEAVQRLRVLDEEGLTWVEEPTLAHDFAGHASISREAKTPIQCGENWWGPQDMQHALDAQASDYVMADVMKIGGVTGWLQAAALADARGIPLSSHLWPEVSAQLMGVTPTAHWLEYMDWWNPVIAEPLTIKDGMALASDAPGSGVCWVERNVEQFAA